MTSIIRMSRLAALLAAALLVLPAQAAEKLRVGKSVPIAWTFTPLDIGVEAGIWAKHDLKLEITSFGGDAAPGSPKQLKIQYRLNGKAGEATFAENDVIVLPVPK